MAGGLLDDPALLDAAAGDAGLDAGRAASSGARPTRSPRRSPRTCAPRARPSPAARALDHRLGGPPDQRRYTAPSYEISAPENGARPIAIPGFHPVEAYEAAIANLAPGLDRRPKPDSVAEVLAWAGMPLATAEVAAIAQLDRREARVELARVARPRAVGADFYWT